MSDQPSASPARPPRRLLPRQTARSSLITAAPSLKPRLSPTVAACNTCRRHKTKCSGERPACQRCVHRHIPCVYTTQPGETVSQALNRNRDQLQDRATVYQRLFNLLKNLSNQDAQVVLKKIRSGDDASAIVNHITTGNILLQMAVTPETRLRYNFPYKTEMPADLIPNNIYLDSLMYESAQLYPEGHYLSSPGDTASSSQQNLASYLRPFHAAQVIEPGLSNAKISWWTAICADDVLMRDLLLAFFRCEYQFTAAFQKDLFLEDLASQRTDFCSSLLVNVVLAYSCVCYIRLPNRAKYWNPQSLFYRFLAEAKRIWELEASEARITTIQAGILLTAIHNLCGLDEIGKAYRIHSVALAQALDLLNDDIDEKHDRLQNGQAFTAWALYNWETLTAYSFMHPPLLKRPPTWSLPDPTKDMRWYGEIWLNYQLDSSLYPSHFDLTLQARCQFRIIMNEFCQLAYSSNRELLRDEAHTFHKRLRSWYVSLPIPLQPRAIVLPGHLQLHIYYHHFIRSMYEPLRDTSRVYRPSTKKIIADAKKAIQTLVRLYYLRHGFEAMDLFITIPLINTAYDCVNAIGDETPELELESLRSTLVLVVQGLFSQRKNHYLAVAVSQVIRSRMRPQEVALLKSVAQSRDEEVPDVDQEIEQVVRSHWPVSIVKDMNDIDSHILTNLVQGYTRLNIDCGRRGSAVEDS